MQAEPTSLNPMLLGLATAFLGGVGTTAIALRGKIDEMLRADRARVYVQLWRATGTFPKYPERAPVTYEVLKRASESFRDWYFDEGGMYLSQSSRSAYEVVQKTIGAILHKNAAGMMSPDDYWSVQDACSRLRTELTRDLLSRSRLLLTIGFQKRTPA